MVYILACKSTEILRSTRLKDIHSTHALSKIRVSSGKDPATASICPWCGKASFDEIFLTSHVRCENCGIILVCDLCREFGDFWMDFMASHIRRNHCSK